MKISLNFFSPLFFLFILSSCAPRLTLLVSPEAQDVGALVAQKARTTPDLGSLVVAPDTTWPKDGLVVRLSTTPNWNLPHGAPRSIPLSSNVLSKNFFPIAALAALGQNKNGDWAVLPVFYDVVGVMAFNPPGAGAPLPQWQDLGKKVWSNRVMFSGHSPLIRQAIFFLETPPTTLPAAQKWFTQTPANWKAALSAVPAWILAPAWAPSTWQFADPDVKFWQKPKTPYVFASTYRQYELTQQPGLVRFQAWQVKRGKDTWITGPVLFLEFYNSASSSKEVKALVNLLTSPSFQGEVGSREKWLAVNLLAPEIDNSSAQVRELARNVSGFIPVTERLPDPLPNDNLMSSLQVAIDYAKKR
ncbi:MAG: hypothetical protein HKM06_01315 [Spirochaetales bacterium]|nr:hypothetical protein [Spirochaetales bacterium]